MKGDIDLLGPRSYDPKEAYTAIAETIDRFLSDVWSSDRLRARHAAAGEAERPGGLTQVHSGGRDHHNDSLIAECIRDIRARANRDSTAVKAAHFLAKRGVTYDSIKDVVKAEVAELLDLPSFDDLGPLLKIEVKSNLRMNISFNGKKWADVAAAQAAPKAKAAKYADAKQGQVSDAAGAAVDAAGAEEEPPEEWSAAQDKWEEILGQAEAVRNPEIPTTIEGWEETIDAALGAGEEEEEEEEAEEDAIKGQLAALLALVGEELPKVKRHLDRAHYFSQRIPTEAQLRMLNTPDGVNCSLVWEVLYEFYSFLHHIDKARYYLAPLLAFLQISSAQASEWVKAWEQDRMWDVEAAGEFFECAEHLHCRKVCYGEKQTVEQNLKAAKEAGRTNRQGYHRLPDEPEAEEIPLGGRRGGYAKLKSDEPYKRLNLRTSSLAYKDEHGSSDADSKVKKCMEKAQSLYELELQLNETQRALYELSQNELVRDAIELAGKSGDIEKAAKKKYKQHKQKGLSSSDDSEWAPLIDPKDREGNSSAADVEDAAIQEVKVEASPMLDRFERFVVGVLKSTDVQGDREEQASRLNNFHGAVAWSQKVDDEIFSGDDPGEIRLARMLLHIYGNVENKPLSERAWTNLCARYDNIDKEKLALNIAFYATSLVITATTGGAGAAVVVGVRAASKACKTATAYALETKSKRDAAATLSASLGADGDGDSGGEGNAALEVDADDLQGFGDKVVSHFLSAMKNWERIEKQTAKMNARQRQVEKWDEFYTEYEKLDTRDPQASIAFFSKWRRKALDEIEAQQREIGDEALGLDDEKARQARRKETKPITEALAKKHRALSEDQAAQVTRFDPEEFLDLTPKFATCDEAAAYIWDTVKFEVHYQKYAFYSTFLLSYAQAALRQLCDWEVVLRRRWGNKDKRGDIAAFAGAWIEEQDYGKHVQEAAGRRIPACGTIVVNKETGLLRGTEQAVGESKSIVMCYGPKDEEGISPVAAKPRHAAALERAQNRAEKQWEDVQEKRKDLLKEWEKLKKKRDTLEGKFETAKRKLDAAKQAVELAKVINVRGIFS